MREVSLMFRILKRMIKWQLNFYRNTKRTLKGLCKIPGIVKQESYYKDKTRKNKLHRYIDNILWTLRYHEDNHFYNMYGMDIVGYKDSDYICYIDFMNSRNEINVKRRDYNYIAILRDKFVFYEFLKGINIATAEVFACLKVVNDNKMLINVSSMGIIDESILENKEFFLKSVSGECADGVFHVKNLLEYKSLKLPNGIYILQNKLNQIKEMNKMGISSINTCRIVTVLENGNPRVFSSVLRCGTKKSGSVDNWAAGGIAVGIDSSGRLEKWGFYKPGHGLMVSKHPDTGIIFSEFTVPFYEKATEIALRAHKALYGIGCIGWDVAITEDGPVLIEGNDNWEISLMQVCNGGLKSEWNKFCDRYKKSL